MLKAFCDETNRNPEEIHFLIAGWTATVEEWERFSTAWDACLSQNPSIEYFKNYEATSLGNQFRKFSTSAMEKKKFQLARVICKHRLQGYVTTIPHAYLGSKPRLMRKKMGTRIYDWAFICQVARILEHSLYSREKGKIDFVFDKCTELRTCINSYEQMIPTLPPQLRSKAGTIVPGDDKDLCAASGRRFSCW